MNIEVLEAHYGTDEPRWLDSDLSGQLRYDEDAGHPEKLNIFAIAERFEAGQRDGDT